MATVVAKPVKGMPMEALSFVIAQNDAVSDILAVGNSRIVALYVPVMEALTAELQVLVSHDGGTFTPLENFNGTTSDLYRIPLSSPAAAHAISLDFMALVGWQFVQFKAQIAAHTSNAQATAARTLIASVIPA